MGSNLLSSTHFRDDVGDVYDRMMVFAGNANRRLAEQVARALNMPLGRATVGRFSDGEVMVEVLENVRGKDVFVLQSTCAPTNDNLMELMVMVDALKRSSAARVSAAIPYYGYARQDRRPRSARVAISAKVVANMLASVGVARVLTMDLHADQIQGFFDVPVDNVYAAPVLLGEVWKQGYEKLIVVSTLRPPRMAHTLAPLPRWATMIRPATSSGASCRS